MDVAVTELRAHLRAWLARARAGQEIVVTEWGLPLARLIGVDTTARLEHLDEQGVIARPDQPRRPPATGRARARSRQPVADVVSELRR